MTALKQAKRREKNPSRPISRQHPPDAFLTNIGLQLPPTQCLPPLKQHPLTDQPKPRRVPPRTMRPRLPFTIPEHLLQLLGSHPSGVLHLILIDVQRHLGLDEQDVVDLVLAPLPIARREVVDPRQKLQGRGRDLIRRDPELMPQFPLRRSLRALDITRQIAVARLGRVCEGVAAAGVGPHVREGDLLARALLQQQPLGRGVEEKDGEGAVQEAVVDVRHEVAGLLRGGPDGRVVGVEDDAHLVHEADLLGVVAVEVVVFWAVAGADAAAAVRGAAAVCRACISGADEAGRHLGEEKVDIFGGDGGRCLGGHCGVGRTRLFPMEHLSGDLVCCVQK